MKYWLTFLFFSGFFTHLNFVFAEAPKIWVFKEESDFFDKVTDGNKTVTLGAWADISDLVKSNPEALKAAESATQYHHYAHLTFIFGFIPSLAGMVYGGFSSRGGLFLASALVNLTSLFVEMHFNSKSRFFMWKGINTFNGVNASKNNSKNEREEWAPLLAVDPLSPIKSISLGFRF